MIAMIKCWYLNESSTWSLWSTYAFLSQCTILGIIHSFLTPLVGRVWIMRLGIDNVNMHRKLMHITILRQNETSVSSWGVKDETWPTTFTRETVFCRFYMHTMCFNQDFYLFFLFFFLFDSPKWPLKAPRIIWRETRVLKSGVDLWPECWS